MASLGINSKFGAKAPEINTAGTPEEREARHPTGE